MLIQCWHWGWVKAEALLLMTFFWNCERQCRWWKTGSALMTTTPFIQRSKKVLGYWGIIIKKSVSGDSLSHSVLFVIPQARLDILKIHSRKMNLTRGINLRKIAELMPGASGAEVKVNQHWFLCILTDLLFFHDFVCCVCARMCVCVCVEIYTHL